MTLRESLALAEQKLIKAGVDDVRTNVEYLAAHVLSLKSRSDLQLKLDQEIFDSQTDAFDQLISRRANREPLQYILGEWEFFGLPIKVGPGALIPRPETEILVEQALSEAAKMPSNISILDIGTGTGCIALAIAKHLPFGSVVGIDVNPGAVDISKENARLLCIPNVSFQIADIFSDDWLNSFPDKFDLIVSNPPYVSKSEFENLEPELSRFEPHTALTDGSDGLTFYKRIALIAPSILSEQGRLVFEIGFGGSKNVEEIIRAAGLEVIRVSNDLAGIPRVIVTGLTIK